MRDKLASNIMTQIVVMIKEKAKSTLRFFLANFNKFRASRGLDDFRRCFNLLES